MINFNPHNHSRANKKVNFGSKQKNIELISTNPMKGIYYSSNFLSSVITQLDQNGKQNGWQLMITLNNSSNEKQISSTDKNYQIDFTSYIRLSEMRDGKQKGINIHAKDDKVTIFSNNRFLEIVNYTIKPK